MATIRIAMRIAQIALIANSLSRAFAITRQDSLTRSDVAGSGQLVSPHVSSLLTSDAEHIPNTTPFPEEDIQHSRAVLAKREDLGNAQTVIYQLRSIPVGISDFREVVRTYRPDAESDSSFNKRLQDTIIPVLKGVSQRLRSVKPLDDYETSQVIYYAGTIEIEYLKAVNEVHTYKPRLDQIQNRAEFKVTFDTFKKYALQIIDRLIDKVPSHRRGQFFEIRATTERLVDAEFAKIVKVG